MFGIEIGIGILKEFIAIISKAGDLLKLVANILTGICKELGIIQPETDEVELGDRAIQAEQEGIKPENYDTYQEYVKAINEFEIDPEKSKQILPEEKLAKALEIEAILLVANNKPEVVSFLELVANHKDYFTDIKCKELGKLLVTAAGDVINISDVVNGREKSFDKIDSAYDALAKIEKQIDPNITDAEADERAHKI